MFVKKKAEIVSSLKFTGDNIKVIVNFCCAGLDVPHMANLYDSENETLLLATDERSYYFVPKGQTVFRYIDEDGNKKIAVLCEPFAEIITQFMRDTCGAKETGDL